MLKNYVPALTGILLLIVLVASCDKPPTNTSTPSTDPAAPPVTQTPKTDPVTKDKSGNSKKPVVLSYYWPVVKQTSEPRTLSMESPNYIDILSNPAHGSADIRQFWTANGKVLLSRINPFRHSLDANVLEEQLRSELRNAAGITIDEVNFARWNSQLRETMATELERARSEFPDKFIAVWDISDWNETTARELKRIGAAANAVVLEIYISEQESEEQGFSRFLAKLEEVLLVAPELEAKIVIGIGAYEKMRRDPESDLSSHLVEQVRYLGCTQRFKNIMGIGIYAPLYLKANEQVVMDQAIKRYFSSTMEQRDCS